jgi:hypothetical protein
MTNFLNSFQNELGIKADTIFTVLATLFVFGMGIIANWIINLLKQRNERKNYKKTINLLLDNLSEICKKQYLITTKALESYSILNNKLIGIQIHVYTPLYFLNKVDYSVFIKNYVRGCNKKLKVKATVRVFKNIGYTNTFESETVSALKQLFELLKPHQETYIKNIFAIEEFGRELPFLEFVDFDLKAGCIQVIEKWQQEKKDNNFSHSFTLLISPLLTLLNKYSMEPNVSKLGIWVKECHVSYSEISHLDKHLQDDFQRFAFENKKVYKELKMILKVFGYKAYN